MRKWLKEIIHEEEQVEVEETKDAEHKEIVEAKVRLLPIQLTISQLHVTVILGSMSLHFLAFFLVWQSFSL